MEKINITETIFNIVNKHPDVVEIMVDLGFKDIAKEGMINTAGRIMTIEKGAKLKNISLDEIITKFKEHGYLVVKEEL